MSLLLARRINAFRTVEPEDNGFEHVRDGFVLFALELVKHASKLHYSLLAHRHIRSHDVEILPSAVLHLLGTRGWLQWMLTLSIHVWRIENGTPSTELKFLSSKSLATLQRMRIFEQRTGNAATACRQAAMNTISLCNLGRTAATRCMQRDGRVSASIWQDDSGSAVGDCTRQADARAGDACVSVTVCECL